MSTLIVICFVGFWLSANPKVFIDSITFKSWNDGFLDKVAAIAFYLMAIIALIGDYLIIFG
jgi:hypothetical protein